jgi:NTP pyrophosphatase (non-canonical NTP hydrolase)
MSDLTQLMASVRDFCTERDWDQFHSPKDLAIGISTEANELLDLFRFKSEADMQFIMSDPAKRELIGQELADVFFFLLRFAQMNDFDLGEELRHKLQLNGQKYPVDESRGSNRKYNE